VVLRRQQLAGDSLELLFPGFFGLDTGNAAGGAAGDHRVLLPRDDLARFAGAWSWRLASDSITVAAAGGGQGFSLSFHPVRDGWEGRLTAWVEPLRSQWALGGRRVDCPRDLIPAGAESSAARSSGPRGGAPSSGP
jgi:hypothetical protein